MFCNLISDLHLEFSDLELPGGDILILAGDVLEARNLQPSTKYARFFKDELSKYRHVIYVKGNHESYHFQFHKTNQRLRDYLPSNVHLLDNDFVEIDGVLFLGATMWTDMNKGDSLTLLHMKTMMQDFNVITYHNTATNVYHKLPPEVTVAEHRKTLQYFNLMLRENRAKKNLPVVVVTHHAPHMLSVADYYKDRTIMNGGYYSDLSEFILDNPEIKFLCHGHMHNKSDYMIGDYSRVLCNPRGYAGHESRANEFDPAFGFEISNPLYKEPQAI